MSVNFQSELFSPSICRAASEAWFPSALSSLQVSERSGWPDVFGDALCSWNLKSESKRITAIGLFSGAGGLDIGFHDAGFSIVECNELEPKFAATLKENSIKGRRLEGCNIVCGDIRDYSPSVKHVDFIIGGPPCQTFSAAGARANGVNGTDDERGNLFLEYARIINQIQPKGFLFENVYRIVGAQGGKPWKKIQDTFQGLGYKLYWRILDAADYGVPQFRERLIIVGLKNGSFNFPYPSHGPDSHDNHPYYTAQEAVAGIDASKCKVGLGGRHGHLLNDIPPGLNYSFYTERMGHPNPLFGWRSKFSDYLYKADPNTPVRTIKAQGGQYTGPFSWENRPFSNEELKRLQTFPDDFTVSGNRQTIIHQLGNSVPPQLARILALSILDQVFEQRIPFALKYLDANSKLRFRARKSELTSVYEDKAKHAISLLPNHDRPSFAKIEGTLAFSLTPDLELIFDAEKSHDYSCSYELIKNEWSITLSEFDCDEIKEFFNIKITPPSHSDTILNGYNVPTQLVSKSPSKKSLLAIWKVYEHLCRTHASKDDLIQLFGYYQYKNNFSFEMNFSSELLSASTFWGVAKEITKGVGIGSIYDITDLAEIYGVSKEVLMEVLCNLKDIGYEIRSHRTNRQIPADHVLVPYSFPTLNNRSLQRLTKL